LLTFNTYADWDRPTVGAPAAVTEISERASETEPQQLHHSDGGEGSNSQPARPAFAFDDGNGNGLYDDPAGRPAPPPPIVPIPTKGPRGVPSPLISSYVYLKQLRLMSHIATALGG
jgi:hypothetical protein